MNNNKSSSSNTGLGLGTILTIIFVVLKLCGVIDWSWWLVFLPVIIGFVLSLIILIVATCVYVHISKKEADPWSYIEKKEKKRKWKF